MKSEYLYDITGSNNAGQNKELHKLQLKMEDIPIGFILFHSPYDYSETCSFCSDFDMDVLEIYIHGFCCLTFLKVPGKEPMHLKQWDFKFWSFLSKNWVIDMWQVWGNV